MTSFDNPPVPSSDHGINGPDGSQWKRMVPMRRAARESEGRRVVAELPDGSRPPPPTRRVSSFINGKSAPITLSLLVLLTLAVQVLLMAYHDDIMVVNRTNRVESRMSVRGEREDGNDEAIGNDADDATEDGIEDLDERPPLRDDEGGGGREKNYSDYSMDPIDILRRADIDHTAGFIPSITGREARLAKKLNKVDSLVRRADKLPTVDEIQSMYGDRPYIAGLERCEQYRLNTVPENRLMGPAGLFNSATNLLEKLLSLNCVNTARERAYAKRHYKIGRKGITNTAPWGKHNPVSWRFHHETKHMTGQGINQSDFMPIVMIKDPITWMASMCRHQYESRWVHTAGHCPNLVPNKYDRRRKPGVGTIELKVKFATKHIGDEPMPDNSNKTFVNYTSLVDMWNVWYGDWRDVDFPRLMVRFEDLLFHAEDVVSKVCECGGGTMARDFRYVEGSAKGEGGPHAGSAGFLASLVTYGNSTLRMKGILTDANDVEYARIHLDKDLLEMFGYAPI